MIMVSFKSRPTCDRSFSQISRGRARLWGRVYTPLHSFLGGCNNFHERVDDEQRREYQVDPAVDHRTEKISRLLIV
jgi:hypothetical protein